MRTRAQRALVDMVLALDEPYRTTVLVRYFDDLSPNEVAERLGVPPSTVRSRLQRGLHALRSRMQDSDASHNLVPGLVLLAEIDGRGLVARTSKLVSLPSSRGLILGSGAAVAILGTVLMATLPAQRPEPMTGDRHGGVDAHSVAEERSPSTSGSVGRLEAAGRDDDVARVPVVPEGLATDPGASTLGWNSEADGLDSLEVVVLNDGQPWSGASVMARRSGYNLIDPSERGQDSISSSPTDRFGVARFDLEGEAITVVAVDNGTPVLLQRKIQSTASRRRKITLKTGTATLTARVVDHLRQPIAEIGVTVGIRDGYDYGALVAVAETGDDGEGDLRTAPRGTILGLD